ncbi:MAG: hypothetical protein ACI88H_001787 [Cocleimonas sp.]|jgi:hypothetical protein
MLILLILSLLFIWLIVREWNTPKEFDTFSLSYMAILAVCALLAGYPYVDHWRFESLLSSKASQLADNKRAKVKCVTVFESVYDQFGLAGTGNPTTGEIVLQYPTCSNLRDYLKSPETANTQGLTSLHVFTHEAMHVRGELNEQKTDCQAIQRNVRAAKMLGVRAHLAEQTARDYYNGAYRSHSYFSEECSPGKKLDENLNDSVW